MDPNKIENYEQFKESHIKLKSYTDSRYGEIHLFKKKGPRDSEEVQNLIMVMEK
jgi:hypothetical protein